MAAYLYVLVGVAFITYLLLKLKQFLEFREIVDHIAGPVALPLLGNTFQIPWDPSGLVRRILRETKTHLSRTF